MTRLSDRIKPVFDSFLADVREHLGQKLSDGLDLDIYTGRGGLTLTVAERGQHPCAYVDANLPGGPEAVAKAVEEVVTDKRPWLL